MTRRTPPVAKRHSFRWMCVLYAAMLLSGSLVAMQNPVAFQKCNAIVRQPLPNDDLRVSQPTVDVASLVRRIPYRSHPQMVYEVHPDEKYRRTILEGDGNCSNLTFGLARYLDRTDTDYEIVHLMPRKRFLRGEGHTVLRVRYRWQGQKRTGIVDVYEGGLPCSRGRLLDVRDLETGGIEDFSLISLHPKKEDGSPYYGEFLDQCVVGRIPSAEVRRYFRFLDSVYLPLGNRRLEKYAYDGLSLLAGYYPTVHVGSVQDVFGPYSWRPLFIGLLWLFRSALVLIPAAFTWELTSLLARVVQTRSSRRRSRALKHLAHRPSPSRVESASKSP